MRPRSRAWLGPVLLLLPLFPLVAPARAQEPQPAEEEILGTRSSFDTETAERVTAPAGARLYERPTLQAPLLASLDAETVFDVIERQGAWARVRHGSFKAWVLAPRGAGAPAAKDEAPLMPPRPSPPDPERLQRAAEILGSRGAATLGPFALLTHVQDERLLARLSEVAASLPEVFRARYGLDATPRTQESVLLFARPEDYQRYAEIEPELAELGADGHAGGGIAALAVGDHDEGETVALLVHELTHLLMRNVLGDDLPGWLDEGVAEELSYSALDRKGHLVAGSLAIRAATSDVLGKDPLEGARTSRLFTMRGPGVQLKNLLDAWNGESRPPLADLVDLSWRELAEPIDRPVRYAESAFLVRFLLDGGDARRAAAFRTYLAAIAQGGPSDSDALATRLGEPWAALEKNLHTWLWQQAVNAMLVAPNRRP